MHIRLEQTIQLRTVPRDVLELQPPLFEIEDWRERRGRRRTTEDRCLEMRPRQRALKGLRDARSTRLDKLVKRMWLLKEADDSKGKWIGKLKFEVGANVMFQNSAVMGKVGKGG